MSDPLSIVSCAAVMLACGMVVGRLCRGDRRRERHRRGVRLRSSRAFEFSLNRASLGRHALPRLEFVGVSLSLHDETRHFKLIGMTGAGKSTAIQGLLEQALARGDRAVFADPDGGYARRFFQRYRGDILLNPLERHSVRWDLFAELQQHADAEDLAASLIVAGVDPGASEWRGYARTLLTSLLRSEWMQAHPHLAELWRLLSRASPEELRRILGETPAAPFLEPDNARMFGSIRAVAVAALAPLEHIVRQRGTPFSVRRWVGAADRDGCLFMPYQARQIGALRALIATWTRLAIFQALSGTAEVDQRLWFVLDELDALGAIDGLKDALARLRKFGGRCVLGFQSVAQVSSLYGHGDAQTIIENCGNTLILRSSSSEQGGTSQFASRQIGEREILRRHVTREFGCRGRGAGGGRSGQTSRQPVIEPAVLASEIEQLPDLEGYFRRAGADHWRRVRLRRRPPCLS